MEHHFCVSKITIPPFLFSSYFNCFGCLYVCALDETLVGQRQTPSLFAAVRQRLGNVWGLRNYIVGPLTEEIVFRGCIVSMHALAGLPKSALVLEIVGAYCRGCGLVASVLPTSENDPIISLL